MSYSKQLYRSRSDRMVAGVAGGIAEYYDAAPTLVRLITLILVLAGGPGLLAYIVAWIIIPEAPITNSKEAAMADPTADQTKPDHTNHAHDHPSHPGREQSRMVGGYILIGLGLIFLLQQVLDVNVWRYGWPIILIIIGLFIIMKRR